jgi:hypothetical protein
MIVITQADLIFIFLWLQVTVYVCRTLRNRTLSLASEWVSFISAQPIALKVGINIDSDPASRDMTDPNSP